MNGLIERVWADRRVLVLVLALVAVTTILSVVLLRFDAYRHLLDVVS